MLEFNIDLKPSIQISEQASIQSYDGSALMAQTRKLASDYREQTGHALPVTEELARFDAINIFGLSKIEDQEGIDACDKIENDASDKDYYLIKGRVIFKGGKARQKLGKLSLAANWTVLLVVIYDPDYLPVEIYSVERIIIERELNKRPQGCSSEDKRSENKRGSMTIAKYKAIGDLVWDNSAQT
ncbi:MAG: hypothetical protein L3J46_01480 [Kangiellaceae bacterium]|nr:hypothetical protein [Kangiellaceae bacterium]